MEQKQIICTKIEYRELGSTGDYSIVKTDQGTFKKALSVTRSGKLTTQELTFDAVIEETEAVFIQSAPKEWKLTTDKGDEIIFGSNEYKARVNQFISEGNQVHAVFIRNVPFGFS